MGGREGHSRTSDGKVDVDLAVPTELGGTGGPGTNPEQPFAVGYAAMLPVGAAAVRRGT
jgi:lipoyl-dependent peroxiredoxin